jgi:hypothetical protein
MNNSQILQATARGASAAALAACLALAACGGNGDTVLAAPRARAAAVESKSPASIQLEGCVAEEMRIPQAGIAVRATSPDGRLLGNATSDEDGVFRLRVPARQTLSIAIDATDGDALEVSTGRTNLSLGACLHDRPARAAAAKSRRIDHAAIDWSGIAAEPDPSPRSIAAYDACTCVAESWRPACPTC